jgi:ATPase subunit of ABC transporter with duplicated ATPase domains
MGMSPKGRQTKSKARIKAYDDLLVCSGPASAVHRADPDPGRRAARRRTSSRWKGVSKGFGDRLLIDDLSFKLPRGGIVGVIGPNGAGKSTLFKMLTGQEKPDSGT